MFSTKGRKTILWVCATLTAVILCICARKGQVPTKQGTHYLARVYFHCRSINIPVCPCVCMHAPLRTCALLVPSGSRSFIPCSPAWPQMRPACRRDVAPGPTLLVLLGRSGQVFFLCSTEEQWVDARPLFNHAEQEKLLDICLYTYMPAPSLLWDHK